MQQRDYGAARDVSSPARYFALIIGVVYLLVGLLGFLPALRGAPSASAPSLAVTAGYGFLLGLFAVNVLHNIVHILIGIVGIASFGRNDAAINFSRGIAILYALLAVFGFFPVLRTTFGLIPLFGNDIWLHAATALVAAYFGWVAPRQMADTGAARPA